MPENRNPNLESQGSGGGGPGGGDLRSLILFTFLALAVFMVFQYFQSRRQMLRRRRPSRRSRIRNRRPQATSAPAQDLEVPDALPRLARWPVATVSAAAETTTTVENEKYRIIFTNKGAQVQHWILKHYTDSTGKPLDMVQLQTARSASGCRFRSSLTTAI